MSKKTEVPEAFLYQEAESKTNRDNIRYLIVLATILILCDVLNEIGLFQVYPLVMRIGTVFGTVMYMIPVVVLAKPLKLFNKHSSELVYNRWYKYFIIIFAWLGTTVGCVMLTHHTVIVMSVPIMLMAQYRDTKKLVNLTMFFGTLCVFLGVYGGYFLGCFDANLLHIGITESNAFDLNLRIEMGTWTRMYDLLTHYVLSRELLLLALILLASRISVRSNEMLNRQAKLQEIAEAEMQKKNEIQWQIIDGMANLIENRDTSTGEHVKRTSYYVKSIVNKLRESQKYSNAISEKEADTIVRAAPLHDIGKIVVADRILQKPGKLTAEEYNEIKLHANEGAEVIKNVLGNVEDEDFLSVASDIAVGHHERWDGNGYPKGIKGNDIPLSARIMAVADVYDALVSKRVYKEAMDPEKAFEIIEEEAGKQFDPDVVKAFISLKPTILKYLSTQNVK